MAGRTGHRPGPARTPYAVVRSPKPFPLGDYRTPTIHQGEVVQVGSGRHGVDADNAYIWVRRADRSERRMAADGVTVAEEVTFVWDGMTLCEQTTTSTDLPHTVTLTWDHDGLQPLAQTERLDDADGREIDNRFFGIVTDLIGTPTELVDEEGEIAWRTRSTLWGTTTWNADANAYTLLRFPGQYFDPESGLHYNCFRYYDPETARYLSVDPLGLGPAPNPVAYVSNPHTWSDPLGLNPCPPKGEKSNPFKLRATPSARHSTPREFLSGLLLMPNGLSWVTRH